MPRGNAGQTKVHYQGKEEDFVVMVDDVEQVQKWKNDRSIPLAQVVSGWKIFITHKYVNSFLINISLYLSTSQRASCTTFGLFLAT